MTLMQEGKIIIDDGDRVDANHVSTELEHKKSSISKVLQPMCSVASPKGKEIIMLQFKSFDPIEVPTMKKTTSKSMQNDFSNSKNGDTWTLIARKRKNVKGLLNSNF